MIRDHEAVDVLVAGARCAGSATALLLARAGRDVLVVDPVPRGRDTLSTHALMRGGVLQLHRWGLLDGLRDAGTPPVRTTTFDYGDERVVVPIEPRDGVDALYAPRRTVLDPLLATAAEEAGARFAYGVSVQELMRDRSGRVVGAWVAGRDRAPVAVRAGTVVGADGVRSTVAARAGAAELHRAGVSTASIYGYWPGLPDDDYRWIFRPGRGLGLIPTNGGAACVFASVAPDAFHARRGEGLEALFHELVAEADRDLADHLRRTPPASPLRAFPGIPGFLREGWGPGWALVGDAGYFKDPLTAHGITDALRDAELLARALLDGSEAALARYQAVRDGVARDFMEVTERIAALDWSTDELQALHRDLSRAMNVGLDAVRALDRPAALAG